MRGQVAEIGATRIAPNGYHYTKVDGPDGGMWRLTHHIIAEKHFGIKITHEHLVRFVDGDRTNLNPKNIQVVMRGRASLRKRKAQIEARIAELTAELRSVERELMA